jgi:hypothetical protein
MNKATSTNLATLLNAQEPVFSLSLRQLEKAGGHGSQDVKLQAEIIEKAHEATRQLGLDPKDTTGPELYGALLAKAEEHDKKLAERLGVEQFDDVKEVNSRVLQVPSEMDVKMDCWVLKKSMAKKFLKAMPPKGMMKILGYRSVDSMLKNENISELFGAIRFSEDGEWLNEFNEQYKTLKPSDFETRKIEMIHMDVEKWGDIAAHFVEKKRHFHTHSKEMGVIVIVPTALEKMAGVATKSLLLTFHYINEIRLYSAFFKLKQVDAKFGEIVVETLIADPSDAAVMAGQNIHWRVVQRYFGKLKDEYHPEAFQPHVQPEDLHWRKAEEMMFQFDDKFEFWKDMDYVAIVHDGRPTTFNLMDVSFGYSNKIPYQERYIYHFREALWNELFIRYMGQGSLEDQILIQLDNDMIKPEELDYDDTPDEQV